MRLFFCFVFFFCHRRTSQRGAAWAPPTIGRRSRRRVQPTGRRELSTAGTATASAPGPWSSTWPVSTCWRASRSWRPHIQPPTPRQLPAAKNVSPWRTRGVRPTQAPLISTHPKSKAGQVTDSRSSHQSPQDGDNQPFWRGASPSYRSAQPYPVFTMCLDEINARVNQKKKMRCS